MIYTVKQAALKLGVAYSTVTMHCRKLGIKKHGRDYLIDDEALRKLRASIIGEVGNPDWRKHDT